MEKITCKYYSLDKQKNMLDGNYISAGQKLLYICSDKKLLQFKTLNSEISISVFWAHENEVTFLEEKIEMWSKKQIEIFQKQIKRNWI